MKLTPTRFRIDSVWSIMSSSVKEGGFFSDLLFVDHHRVHEVARINDDFFLLILHSL